MKTSNFGILNHIFEEQLPTLFKQNKKAVRDVVKLIKEDNNLKNEFEELPKDSLFYVSSFLGYGLYEKFIFTKEELMEKFPLVFTRKKN